jgi:hypothetical protein
MKLWRHYLTLCAILASIPGLLKADNNWIEWLTDYREGLRIAKQTHKPLFVEFRCEA